MVRSWNFLQHMLDSVQLVSLKEALKWNELLV